MTTLDEAREILAKEYYLDNFEYLVKDILLPDYKAEKHEVAFNNSIFSSVIELGHSSTCDLGIYEVKLNEGCQNRRVTITQEMFRILRGIHADNALVAFVNSDRNNYRISLLTSKYEYNGDKIVKTLSNPRRYSYSLGIGTKTKTAYKFLIGKGKVQNLDEIISRFSIEVVNKQFYSEIATSFTELVGGERDGKTYDKLLQIHSVIDHNKYAEFGVRLIGRIMFCWFLREKRSDKDIPLVPDDMLALETISRETNYYHNILEPLFFELLNTSHKKRKDGFDTDYYKQIPYLNGGLFSPHSDDHYRFDPNIRCGQYGVVTIPNEWFIRLYQTLSQYNFTVDENTAYDIELSIDPEMLGRIFENLLAEINPETGENAKKSTGSFYTPRDIVDYMVDSSLCEYLKTKTKLDEVRLNALISYNKDDDDLAAFDSVEKKKLIDALYMVTVLDPACGSGAFPIGMLQKIVYVLQELDPDANLWFDKATENVGILLKKEFEKKFNAGSLNYIRKLSVIQNSIFGIDIQPIAVEISRLRCFLSLIIEEKVDDAEENRGINPLPNLDFKFIIANSLISLDSTSQTSIFENQDHIKQLRDIREEYFNADSERRTELKLEFKSVQQDMLLNTIANYQKQASVKYQQLSEWKPFENQATAWFDPEWMFGIKDGFDIVIGNPPYIKIQNIGKNFSNYYKKNYYSASGKFDIYVLFDELSYALIKNNGITCFIQPHRFLVADYAKKLRSFIGNNRYLYKFVNFGVNQIFNSATTYTGIFFFKKSSDCIRYADSIEADLSRLIFNKVDYSVMNERWVFGNNNEQGILNKILACDLKVLDIFKGIYQGAITVGDDIFVLKCNYIDEYFHGFSVAINREVTIETDMVKHLLKGENIKRYSIPSSSIYILYPHKEVFGKTVPYEEYELREKFPKFYEYISNFKTYLKDKKVKYKTNPTYWYSLHRAREKQLFESVKIITPQLQNYPNFTIDNGKFYPDAGGYMLISSLDIDKTKPYYAILNSRLFWYFIKNTSTPFNNGYYYFKTAYIEPFKFPRIDVKTKMLLSTKIDNIIQDKANGVSSDRVEREIDQIVYKIYNLTDEEIALVEESAK